MKIVTKKFLSFALAGVMFTSTGAATVTAHADDIITDTSIEQNDGTEYIVKGEKLWRMNHPRPWKRPPRPEDACLPGDAWIKEPEQPKVKRFPHKH